MESEEDINHGQAPWTLLCRQESLQHITTIFKIMTHYGLIIVVAIIVATTWMVVLLQAEPSFANELLSISNSTNATASSPRGLQIISNNDTTSTTAEAVSLLLIDTSTNEVIAILSNDTEIDLTTLSTYTLPKPSLNIQALVVAGGDDDDVKSVVFRYDTPGRRLFPLYATRTKAPFLLCPTSRRLLSRRHCSMSLQQEGTHAITVTTHSSSQRWWGWSWWLGGSSSSGGTTTVSVSFNVVINYNNNTTTNTTQPPQGPTNTTTPPPPTNTTTPPINTNTTTGTNTTNNNTNPVKCTVPKFVGEWQNRNPPYPLNVAEAQGAMIGSKDFLLVSGFHNAYDKATPQTYALDLVVTNTTASVWRRMDDLPVTVGVTHGASVIVNNTLFIMCGGYVGGHPGPDTNQCFVYNHSIVPGNGKQSQWSTTMIPSLPSGRAGGGMIYDARRRVLVFAAGGKRPKLGDANAVDYNTTWMYSFDNAGAGWVRKADIPFFANHMSYVTVNDPKTLSPRHYFVGGQRGENEFTGNVVDHYEFDVLQEVWIKRKSLPVSRGHAASSTRPIGCGYIIAAGSTNEYGKTADVSYYDIVNDTWTTIGLLPSALNSPICDVRNEYLYCESGWTGSTFSYRRKITW